MDSLPRLVLTLAVVAVIAAGALALTYGATKERIAGQEAAVQERALETIFLDGFARTETIGETVRAVYAEDESQTPRWYAATGKGIGYNTGVPITVLVGFANPRAAEAEEATIVGWRVINSEETPGLGEKAKESEPAYTLLELATGSAKPAGKDRATAFQKQFRGRTPEELKLARDGGPIDVITAATYTTLGIIEAIRDAKKNLDAAIRDSK
jgi:Na+-translocating ferredoxin:NAD+ oxidoreductase subunit G